MLSQAPLAAIIAFLFYFLVGLLALILGGCQQQTSFPRQIAATVENVEQPIVQGDLELVQYDAGAAEPVTLEFSELGSRPKGTLYRDYLVIVHELEKPQKQTEPAGSRWFERTTQVIPARSITSIKFFETGLTVTVSP